MKKIFYMMLLAAGALVSCTEDYDYDPAAPYSAEGVKVSFVPASSVVLAQSDNSFEVTVARTETEGELTIPIKVLAADDVFEVPSSVTFADGEAEATLTVNVKENMKTFTDYALKLTTSPELLDYYTEAQDNFYLFSSNVVKEDFQPVALGLFTDNVYYGDAWEIELEYSEMLDLYRLASPYEYGFNVYLNWKKGDAEVVICDKDGNAKKSTPLGFSYYSYGMVSWTVLGDNTYDAETETFAFPMATTVTLGKIGEGVSTFQITEWYDEESEGQE